MCGRFSLTVPREDLEATYDASFAAYEPSFNCAPGQDLPVIPGASPDTASLQTWGFTPTWADESFDLINARSETVREKPAFRDAFATNRCLVPADGFYEWADLGDGKRPYRVCFADDRPFVMAGISAEWEPSSAQAGLDAFGGGTSGDDRAADSTTIESFAILTTEPNDLIADLHHRMAAIVRPDDIETYLHGTPEEAAAVLDPHPADDLRFYQVSTQVNDPSNDAPSLIQPV